MFLDMFDSMDAGKSPREDFYDGYVVNAIIDACYKSAKTKQWEPVELEWRESGSRPKIQAIGAEYEGKVVIKEELMPNGSTKRILKDKQTGEISEVVA